MHLYHGTSENAWNCIREQGLILPRTKSRKNNWKHTVSAHPNAVYLTNCYAPYFAMMSHDVMTLLPAKAAIIEIESDCIAAGLTYDEDALEQSTRRGKISRKEMYERTAVARGKLAGLAGTDAWKDSLSYMGTCAHIGPVPLSAITRVALVDIREHSEWSWSAMEPTITRANYNFCGYKYVDLTAEAFQVGEIVYEAKRNCGPVSRMDSRLIYEEC